MRTILDKDKPAGFAISKDLLMALSLVVISCSSNVNERFKMEVSYSHYGLTLDLNEYWGEDKLLDEFLLQINNN